MQIRNIVKDELLKFAVKSGRIILSADDCDEFAKLVEEKFKSTNTGRPKFCPRCVDFDRLLGHMADACHCPFCGTKLRAST